MRGLEEASDERGPPDGDSLAVVRGLEIDGAGAASGDGRDGALRVGPDAGVVDVDPGSQTAVGVECGCLRTGRGSSRGRAAAEDAGEGEDAADDASHSQDSLHEARREPAA